MWVLRPVIERVALLCAYQPGSVDARELRPSSAMILGQLFFFQAEDGIRDYKVTGVQTCALPIFDAILVNIFGGITRGDEVARGLIEARKAQQRDVPMVVRIVGTNAEEAGRLLREAQDRKSVV